MRSYRQPVATHGTGFRLSERFSRASHLPPVTLEGDFGRGSVLRPRVRAEVARASIPHLGANGTLEVSGDAAAPVDRYLTAPAP